MAILNLSKKETWVLLGEVAFQVVDMKDIYYEADVGKDALDLAYQILWRDHKIEVETYLTSGGVRSALKNAAARNVSDNANQWEEEEHAYPE